MTPSLSPRVKPQGLYTPHILQHGIPSYPMTMNSQPTQQPSEPQPTSQKPGKVAKIEASQCLESTPYPDFKFNHMFSMLVVGPTQWGVCKTRTGYLRMADADGKMRITKKVRRKKTRNVDGKKIK